MPLGQRSQHITDAIDAALDEGRSLRQIRIVISRQDWPGEWKQRAFAYAKSQAHRRRLETAVERTISNPKFGTVTLSGVEVLDDDRILIWVHAEKDGAPYVHKKGQPDEPVDWIVTEMPVDIVVGSEPNPDHDPNDPASPAELAITREDVKQAFLGCLANMLEPRLP